MGKRNIGKSNAGIASSMNDNNVTLRRDTSVDNSGNPTVRPRQISNIDEGSNRGTSGPGPVTDAKF